MTTTTTTKQGCCCWKRILQLLKRRYANEASFAFPRCSRRPLYFYKHNNTGFTANNRSMLYYLDDSLRLRRWWLYCIDQDGFLQEWILEAWTSRMLVVDQDGFQNWFYRRKERSTSVGNPSKGLPFLTRMPLPQQTSSIVAKQILFLCLGMEEENNPWKQVSFA